MPPPGTRLVNISGLFYCFFLARRKLEEKTKTHTNNVMLKIAFDSGDSSIDFSSYIYKIISYDF